MLATGSRSYKRNNHSLSTPEKHKLKSKTETEIKTGVSLWTGLFLFCSQGWCTRVFTLLVSFSWLAFEGAGFSSRMYVLEVGSYADRRAMGCVDPHSSILSLQTAGFVSDPLLS